MSRFTMLFVCCVCIAGVSGGAAGAAMTAPDWPADGAALLVASVRAAGSDALSVPEASVGYVASTVSFVRGAEHPSWLPDMMRGLVPWWMGGKPGVLMSRRWGGGGSGRRALPFVERGAEADASSDASVDDYSELWYDRWVVRSDSETERYEVSSRQWEDRTGVDRVDVRDATPDPPEIMELNDDRSDERYVEDR